MNDYQEFIVRKRKEYGDKFDISNLDPRFIRYFESGQRIKVTTCDMTITGTIGVTTGWKPSFLLMRTTRSIGSCWTLGPQDTIEAVQIGKHYRPVSA